MIESSVVNEWIALGREKGLAEGKAEGKAEGRAEHATTTLVAILEAKFGRVPAEVEAAVRVCTDLTKLQTWTTRAATATTLAEFRAAVGL